MSTLILSAEREKLSPLDYIDYLRMLRGAIASLGLRLTEREVGPELVLSGSTADLACLATWKMGYDAIRQQMQDKAKVAGASNPPPRRTSDANLGAVLETAYYPVQKVSISYDNLPSTPPARGAGRYSMTADEDGELSPFESSEVDKLLQNFLST